MICVSPVSLGELLLDKHSRRPVLKRSTFSGGIVGHCSFPLFTISRESTIFHVHICNLSSYQYTVHDLRHVL